MEENRADLEQAMVRAHEIAKENAIKMVKHNERMGRWRSVKSGDIDIPVKFEIAVETQPGQRASPWSARGTTGTSPRRSRWCGPRGTCGR